MANQGTRIDVDNAVMDPTRYFSRPCEVLDDARLNRDEKRRILQSWALDAELISEAESENMRGRDGDRLYLHEAKLALLKLEG
ncbi:MAG: hypothetical protein HW417_931 [Steroidobacteraceae bacterium]|nr:hypothetical protein [Steroidobacteraceae bacterium]